MLRTRPLRATSWPATSSGAVIASLAQEVPQLVRGIVVAIGCSEKPDLDRDIELLRPCSNQACVLQIFFG
jgi:hypothetical protein